MKKIISLTAATALAAAAMLGGAGTAQALTPAQKKTLAAYKANKVKQLRAAPCTTFKPKPHVTNRFLMEAFLKDTLDMNLSMTNDQFKRARFTAEYEVWKDLGVKRAIECGYITNTGLGGMLGGSAGGSSFSS